MSLLAFCSLAIVLFFKRRAAFPRLFVALILGNLVFLILDHACVQMIPAAASKTSGKPDAVLGQAVLHGIIWTLYMLKSKRVKNTFVR